MKPLYTPNTEHTISNAETGGNKGQKLARFDLIPARSLFALAEQFGIGANKYDDRNWEKGYEWSLCFAAMMRHRWAWWEGEDIDEESGLTHLAAAMWHASVLIEFSNTHPEMDNRPNSL